jgi:signal transduction histidine kinase
MSRAIACMLLLALWLPGIAEARKSVLLLFDEDASLPGLAVINRSLRDSLRAGLQGDVEFYSESLNISQFKEPDRDAGLREHFQRKYGGKRLDLIVAVMEPALDFLLRHGAALFPGVPIVICGADSADVEGRRLPPNITGVLVKRVYGPTLDVALRLQPDTREVFVVAGTSRFEQRLLGIARRDLEAFAGRVRITYLGDLPMDELLGTLSRLPPHSIVYYLPLFADGAGRAFVPHEVVARVSSAANAPVYVSVDQFVGLGAVGGNVYSIDVHGRRAAEVALRVLRGEAPASLPLAEQATYENRFDRRELQRWGLDERRLPPDSLVLFGTPSIWDLYKWHIVTGVTLLLLQSGLIAGLLLAGARRRRAERAARESEERRRRAEQEAQKQRDELAHALRMTTLGELTASIAHELRQPLTAIVANAQAARQFLAADQPALGEVGEALDDIAEGGRRAGHTIERLRNLFRKEHAERAPVDMNDVIDDVLQLLGYMIRGKNIRVRFAPGEGLPRVLGDSIQLRQVVTNLLVNAVDAVAAADREPRDIHIDTRLSVAGQVTVAIRDSGVGAGENDLDRIFEHFVTSKPQGLGMGLTISRSIVEAHGGRIWATRNEIHGLTLHVELPAMELRKAA